MRPIRLDNSFDLVNDVIDLMFAEFRHITLWWKRVKRLYDGLALANQSNQFDIVISVPLPGRIGDDLVQFLEPSVEANLDVFRSM